MQSQERLGETDLRRRLVEPSQVSNEIQAWSEIFEQKNNDKSTKMREEMEDKLDAILMDIKTSRSTSMTTNPRSEIHKTGNMQPSGSGGKKSMGVNASYNESLDSENEDIPLKASEMRDLRHPAKPIHQNDTTLDATVMFNEESDEEDYHMVTGANKPLHKQSSQNTQLLGDTLGSHANRNSSTSRTKPLDTVNQIAQAIEKLANKNSQQSLFHPK